MCWNQLQKMTKTKDDRQFEILDARLIDIQGRLSRIARRFTNLERKVDTMSSNIDRIEKEAADAAENVGLVRTAMEELKAVSEAMKTEIQALKDQVTQGQLDQARLDQAAATFEKADDDMDALVLPGTPPEPQPES